MRLTHPASALATLATVALVLGGCSGDEEPAAPQSEPTSAADDGGVLRPGECKLKGSVTGDQDAEFKTKGEYIAASDDTQPGLYRFKIKNGQVSVYAAGGDIKDAVTVVLGDKNYASTTPEGLEVDPAGEGASIDTPAVSTDGEIQVVAEVTCDKQ